MDTMSPFSQWLRALPSPYSSVCFDNENLDYIWFQYRAGWFITIEEKRMGAICTAAQKDTHGIVAQMLTTASGSNCETMRGNRPIEYRGHFVIRFSHTTPDDSDWITINGEPATKDMVMRLLGIGSIK